MASQSQSEIEKKLASLQADFKRSLAEKVQQIETIWDSVVAGNADDSAIKDCYRMVHTLAGSGGTFGAVVVTTASRNLIHALKSISHESELSDDFKTIVFDLILKLKAVANDWEPSKIPYFQPLEDKSIGKRNGNLIYIAEDDELLAKDLVTHLEHDNFIVKHFSDLDTFVDAFAFEIPSAIIMDIMFKEGDIAGTETIMKLNKEIGSCPPIIFISVRNDIEARLAAAKAGAQRYFPKPINKAKLSQTLDGLIERTEIKPFRILLVDDDINLLKYYEMILDEAGMDVLTLSNPMDSVEALEEFKPDVIVLDVYMPECSGPEIAQVIRQDDKWTMTPIMFLSVETDIDIQLNAMNLGGESFMIKPIAADHLVTAVTTKAKKARWSHRINDDLKIALRESEFQLVTSNEHDIVSTADVAGRIMSINDKFCEISGYSREELIGQNHRLLKSKNHPDSFYEEMWQTIASGQVWHGTICNYNKKGEEYWVESTIVPFLDEKGKPYKYVSARTDVTAVRKNEERLERSQAYAEIGTWDWDIKKDEIYWSAKVKQLYGYPLELNNITFTHFKKRIHPDDVEIVEKAVIDCMEKGVKYDVEHRMVWEDGSVHWMSQRGDVIRNASGEPTHFLGLAQDITKRITAETKQRESEERFSFAVEGAGDGVWDWDMRSNAMQFSRLYMQMLGYDENELPHVADTWLNSVHPDDFAGVQKHLQEYLNQKISKYVVELRLRCKDDSYKWILCRGTVVERDHEGKAVRMIGIHSDITKNKQNEYALIESREEAETANRAKSEFLSSMSHELRTPMNAIMGFSQLLGLEIEQALTKDQKENLNEILKASEHLLELINEVLDLAQIEAGRIDLSIEDVNLGNIIIESLQLILPLANKRGISIKLLRDDTEFDISELSSEKHFVRADYTRIKQVLINLLSNAVKYNSENGNITIKFEKLDDHHTRISVIDTGDGLNLSQQEQLFTAFNRLGAENSEVEGTGIGLVITKNIIDLMGGQIGVESHVGEGSTFWFELPSSTGGLETDKNDKLLSAVNMEFTEERTVLYIEDNPANLRLVTQLLGHLPNIHMWSAHEPLLGLDLAEQNNPDLILLDINLPSMDGFEVLKLLKQRETTRNTPVIAISANAMPKDIEKGFAAGFDDYITKPINIAALLKAVEEKLVNATNK